MTTIKRTIGIDLGTTNSCVAVFEDGAARVLENSEGERTTPSIVAFTKEGKILVGGSAKRQAVTNPMNTIHAVKRLIGKKYNDPTVTNGQKLVSYKIVEATNGTGRAWVEVQGEKKSPEAISAIILRNLIESAESKLHAKVEEAVITVPAYFDDDQLKATKDAAQAAGLKKVVILREPTSAAVAYGLNKKNDTTERKIAVYDLGGGTFDVSILEIVEGFFDVKSTSGDTFLGGEDFDMRLLQYLVSEFKQATGVDLSKDPLALQRLKEATEKAKKDLSTVEETEINLPYITADSSGPKHLIQKISRSKLESLVDDLIQRTIEPCKQALKDAGLSTSDIDEVVLVGGMTRMPKIIDTVHKFFGKKPHKGINPDEAVAVGAAIHAAGELEGIETGITVRDVLPISLGIATQQGSEKGVFHIIIPKAEPIPAKKVQEGFSTAVDNQTAVTIEVYQGERTRVKDNKKLGTFELSGIAPAPMGMPKIAVTFELDMNGILHVSAKDQKTGKENSIKIHNAGGLSEEEIAKIMADVEAHSEEDKLYKEMLSVKNEAEGLMRDTEKSLSDYADKIPVSDKETIDSDIKALKTSLESEQISDIRSKIEALKVSSQKIGTAVYDSQEQANNSQEENDKKKEIDAQYEDVSKQ
jgi:molecular chaperone DnaK